MHSDARQSTMTTENNRPIVYDVGMKNGDDSAYYLAKGYRVIGIDANPEMCRLCEKRFSQEISDGSMTVLNVGVSDTPGVATFFINKEIPSISTFEPARFENEEWAPKEWDPVSVETVRLSSIIAERGFPEFIKVDVEFYDGKVLRDLLVNGIKPKYISAEAQEIDTYCLLVALGYTKFKIVDGPTVQDKYSNMEILRLDGTRFNYSFPYESSGPFGPDLDGAEFGKVRALVTLLRHGLGWVDVHAFD